MLLQIVPLAIWLLCPYNQTLTSASMHQLVVNRSDVTLYTEHTGQPDKPVVLLMIGATASMLWWDDAFCRQLANRGYFVIPYDNQAQFPS